MAWLALQRREFASTNQKHYPNFGSETSSLSNFCARFSDVISRGNHWWDREMSAILSGYLRSQTLAVKSLHVDKLALQTTLIKPNLVLSVVGVWLVRSVILTQSNRANRHRDSQSRDVLFLCWLPVHTVQRGLQLDDHHHVQIR